MRIYLMRHGEPDFPGGKPLCLGSTNLPLSTLGRLQAALLALELSERVDAVYSSPLERALQTAQPFALPILVLGGLREQAAGDWEGLGFDEIRERWPELYALRGETPFLPIPGAEAEDIVKARFASAVASMKPSDVGCAAATHAGAIRLYLESLGLPGVKIPYGSYVELERGKSVSVEAVGVLPHPELTEDRGLALLKAAGCPEGTVRHSAAVAAVAVEIARRMRLNVPLVRRSALLHDIARALPGHAEIGAEWLESLGSPDEAAIVRLHNDHSGEVFDNAAAVFLADKLVMGAKQCTLAERFAASEDKCSTPPAMAAHVRRQAAAQNLMSLYMKRGNRI